MPSIEIRGVGASVYETYDVDEIHFKDGQQIGIGEIFKRLGAESIEETVSMAFRSPEINEQIRKDIEKYRRLTGRQFPRGYKILLRIEIEELPDEEARKLWILPVESP